jgi:hypothetical protein
VTGQDILSDLSAVRSLFEQYDTPRGKRLHRAAVSVDSASSVSSVPGNARDCYFAIKDDLSQALDSKAASDLCQRHGIPPLASSDLEAIFKQLREKNLFWWNAELGGSVSEEFLETIEALEIPAKKRIVGKIRQFQILVVKKL